MKSLFVRLMCLFLMFSFSIGFLLYTTQNPQTVLDSKEAFPWIIFIMTIVVSSIGIILPNIKTRKYKINIDEKNIPEQFNTIYNNLYASYIFDLEQNRKKVRLKTIIANILLGIFLICYMMSKFEVNLISARINSLISIVGLIAFPVYIIVVYKNYKYKKNYEYMYKNNILKEFIRIINDKLEYNIVGAYQLESAYKEAAFDNKKFNRFKADDYIEGQLNENTFIKMVDIDVKNVTGSGKSRNTEEIFEGLFAITNCNKDIGEYIKITRDKRDFFGGQDKIEMDNAEFEDLFNVYTTNRILTTRLLTADIMQTLIVFYNKYKLMFEIVIRNNTIYLRFNTGAMFEPKIFGNSMDKELLYIYYCILEFILQITTEVNKTVNDLDI